MRAAPVKGMRQMMRVARNTGLWCVLSQDPHQEKRVIQRSLRLSALVAATLLLGMPGGCADATDPVQTPPQPALPTPTSIEALTSLIISGTVGTPVEPSPTVRVLDQYGKPMRDVEMRFLATAGYGSVAITYPKTDENGIASGGVWTLGTSAGRNVLQVSTARVMAIAFTATAAAGPPARMTHAGGSDQRGAPGVALHEPLRVRITDVFNNALAGISTVFAVVSGEGTIADPTTVTDAGGIATSGAWTPGESGLQQVSAKSGALEVVFTSYPAPRDCTPAASCGVSGRLAFSRAGGIYAANVDGTNVVQLADSGHGGTWSPDGSRFAFSRYSNADKGRQIYIVNADGSNLVKRTSGAGHRNDPAWSPDGQKIVFRDYVTSPVLYSISADGGEGPVLILASSEQGPWIDAPSWSPDGTRIAFNYGGKLTLMNSDGTGLTRIGSTDTRLFVNRPTWSPDGRHIAVTEETDCDWDYWCALSIRVVEVSSGTSTLLVYGSRDQPAWQPAWSSDGAAIAFTERKCGAGPCSPRVAFIKVDGSAGGVIMADASNATWKR